jgi:hypothetical protein
MPVRGAFCQRQLQLQLNLTANGQSPKTQAGALCWCYFHCHRAIRSIGMLALEGYQQIHQQGPVTIKTHQKQNRKGVQI